MITSFFLYCDRSGKMPFISANEIQPNKAVYNTHPYYIRYVNNRPVAFHGPINVLAGNVKGDKVWDYNKSEFVPMPPQE